MKSPPPDLLTCPFCGTAMHWHKACFSHPRPSVGDCILRYYSFDRQKAKGWNTRTAQGLGAEQESPEAITFLRRLASSTDNEQSRGCYLYAAEAIERGEHREMKK